MKQPGKNAADAKKTSESAAAVKNAKVSTIDPESGFMHGDKKTARLLSVDMDAGYFTAAVCHLTQELGIAMAPGYCILNKGQSDFQEKHLTIITAARQSRR